MLCYTSVCEGERENERNDSFILWNPLSADRLGVGSSWEPLSASTSQNSARERSG
jgi:hypothetical protein